MNETDIYREWAPPSGWEEVVACCWEQRVSAARVQRVLPDGHGDLIMYDTGRFEVVGLHDQVALPVLPAGAHLRGIRFRPAAVAAAFGTPASLLRNRTVPADTVLSSQMARRLMDADAIDMWIRSIKPNPRTCAAVNLLTSRSVDEVALALDISGRHLRRLVLADIGLPPKVYQQVVRLQRFVRAIDAAITKFESPRTNGSSPLSLSTSQFTTARFDSLTFAALPVSHKISGNQSRTAGVDLLVETRSPDWWAQVRCLFATRDVAGLGRRGRYFVSVFGISSGMGS